MSDRPSPPDNPEQRDDPPLSPLKFALANFGFLAVLLAVMWGGLAYRGIRRFPSEPTWHIAGGDAERGRAAILSHGCAGCHRIPGVQGATGRVGPPLDGFAGRMYIGGQLTNIPENLIAWLQDPPRHAPGTAMPNLGISEPVARDMAAYLYSNP